MHTAPSSEDTVFPQGRFEDSFQVVDQEAIVKWQDRGVNTHCVEIVHIKQLNGIRFLHYASQLFGTFHKSDVAELADHDFAEG